MSARATGPAPIDVAALVAGVARLARFGRVRHVDTTESTNAAALEMLAAPSSLGVTLVAEEQSRGRGRGGREWLAPLRSSLLMSTILPDEIGGPALPAVGFWASLQVAGAVREVCGVSAAFKWPNDLLVGTRKLAGILIESRSSGAGARVVVGVGVNVNRPDSMPCVLRERAAWLSDAAGRSVDRTALAVAVLRHYERGYQDLTRRPGGVIKSWAASAGIVGRLVHVHDAAGVQICEGTVIGVADDGALHVTSRAGRVTVRLGDVSAE
jgi:BirA family transcriptional regulator, biotin operon repressor / biotin---[acetyl-CoA-carboxylase] ligase